MGCAPPPVSVDSTDGVLLRHEDSDDEEADEDENTAGTLLADSQELFITLEPVPSQPSQDCTTETQGGEGTSAAAHLSLQPPSCPSRRLSQIRKRKKKTCDELFNELMQNSHAEATRQSEWRETFLEAQNTWRQSFLGARQESRAALAAREKRSQEREERRMDVMLRIMEDQSNMLWSLVELHQDQRSPLQPLSNHLSSSPSPIASSPRCGVRTQGEGGGSGD